MSNQNENDFIALRKIGKIVTQCLHTLVISKGKPLITTLPA